MMINAGDNANPANGALVTANVKVVDGTSIADATAAIAAAEADRSLIHVDRVVAKGFFRNKSGRRQGSCRSDLYIRQLGIECYQQEHVPVC